VCRSAIVYFVWHISSQTVVLFISVLCTLELCGIVVVVFVCVSFVNHVLLMFHYIFIVSVCYMLLTKSLTGCYGN